jgi:hypothetical protein
MVVVCEDGLRISFVQESLDGLRADRVALIGFLDGEMSLSVFGE